MSPLALFGSRSGHQPLFNELCRYHNLDRKVRQLLRNVSAKYCAEKPANLFLLPDLLRRAVEDPDFAEQTETLQELYKEWFTDTNERSKGKR